MGMQDLVADGPAVVDVFRTRDAGPTVAPHKISAVSAGDKNRLTVEVLITGAEVRYMKIVVGGDSKTGKRLYRRGLMCGGNDRCGPGRRSLRRNTGTGGTWDTGEIDLLHAAITDGGADGTRSLNVYVSGDQLISGG